MASYGYTFQSGDGVTPTRLNDARTVSDIVNADISATAAIAATKLASDSITNTQIKSDAAIAASKLADTLDLSTKTVTLPATATRNGSQIYSRNNILGTVAQSGGTPTGAVIERGSTANGGYARFADGTQICQISVNLDSTNVISGGSLYYTQDASQVTWTFPFAFVSAPSVHGSITGSSVAMWGVARSVGTTTAILQAVSDRSRGSTGFVFTAIGRWF